MWTALFLTVLSGSSALAQRPNETLLRKAADSLYEAGDYTGAEALLRGLIKDDPTDPRYHHILGDNLKRQGKLEEAMAEYRLALKNDGANAELYKSMGSVSKWMKNNSSARRYYEKALTLNPNDTEARADLSDLGKSSGISLRLWAGGWEPDYTVKAYEAMLGIHTIDKLDIYAGYGFTDQYYYEWDKFYAKAYYFYNPRSYIKVAGSLKDYDYPVDPEVAKPNPDSSSYDKVPSFEVEIAHWITQNVRATLAYEYFKPTFFFDTDVSANNHKGSGELYWITPLEYLKLKVIVAVLRDPDPDRTTIKGRPLPNNILVLATATDVRYQTSTLIGGAVELDSGPWSAGVKYLPNRDLDSSYSYSIFSKLEYSFTDRFRGRLDHLYDKYSDESSYSRKDANVYMGSFYYELSDGTEVGFGYKHMDLPTKDDDTGFISLTYKTGVGS